MKKQLIATLVGGVLIFFWQFLSWTALNVHGAEFTYTPNEGKILEALSQNLPASGISEDNIILVLKINKLNKRYVILINFVNWNRKKTWKLDSVSFYQFYLYLVIKMINTKHYQKNIKSFRLYSPIQQIIKIITLIYLISIC